MDIPMFKVGQVAPLLVVIILTFVHTTPILLSKHIEMTTFPLHNASKMSGGPQTRRTSLEHALSLVSVAGFTW